MNRLPFLAQRLFNVPLLLRPEKAEVLMAALAERMGVAHLFNGGQEVALAPPLLDASERADMRPYSVVAGVAIIPVTGTLVQKLGAVRPVSGMCGYDGLRMCFLDAVEDPQVSAIVLDIDSPGGECAGLFDLTDTIYGARGTKPIRAILNEDAFSAAYAIASAADRITVPRTGGTGSVGVIVLHAEMSKALDKDGINVTLIRYGAQKYEGNQYEPLDKAARGRMQADVDAIGEMFVDTVARNRGLSAAAVRGMEAATYLGAEGVKAGLADAVQAPDAAFRELLTQLAA